MAQIHLLPCPHCDQSIQVEVKQAGREIQCPSCGDDVMLPTMGGIRQLPTADADEKSSSSPAGQASKPSGLKSWLFSGGLILTVLSLVAGVAIWLYANTLVTDTEAKAKAELAGILGNIESSNPSQLWDIWYETTERGSLPEWKETVELRYNRQASYLKIIASAFLGLAALGLICLVSSFFLPNR